MADPRRRAILSAHEQGAARATRQWVGEIHQARTWATHLVSERLRSGRADQHVAHQLFFWESDPIEASQ